MNDFERFQQSIFDELDERKLARRQWIVGQFVELGRRFRIDVVAEILDNGKSAPEVFDAIYQAQAQN